MKTKVVILDGDLLARFTAVAILDYDGYDVLPADNLVGALGLIKSHQPSLIISDVLQPYLTCDEAVQVFRQHCPAIAILMVAPAANDFISMGCRGSSKFAWLRKPFRAGQLREQVNGLLHPKQAAGAAVSPTYPQPLTLAAYPAATRKN